MCWCHSSVAVAAGVATQRRVVHARASVGAEFDASTIGWRASHSSEISSGSTWVEAAVAETEIEASVIGTSYVSTTVIVIGSVTARRFGIGGVAEVSVIATVTVVDDRMDEAAQSESVALNGPTQSVRSEAVVGDSRLGPIGSCEWGEERAAAYVEMVATEGPRDNSSLVDAMSK